MIIKSFLRKKDTKIYFVIITIIILVISILLSFIKYYEKIVDDIYKERSTLIIKSDNDSLPFLKKYSYLDNFKRVVFVKGNKKDSNVTNNGLTITENNNRLEKIFSYGKNQNEAIVKSDETLNDNQVVIGIPDVEYNNYSDKEISLIYENKTYTFTIKDIYKSKLSEIKVSSNVFNKLLSNTNYYLYTSDINSYNKSRGLINDLNSNKNLTNVDVKIDSYFFGFESNTLYKYNDLSNVLKVITYIIIFIFIIFTIVVNNNQINDLKKNLNLEYKLGYNKLQVKLNLFKRLFLLHLLSIASSTLVLPVAILIINKLFDITLSFPNMSIFIIMFLIMDSTLLLKNINFICERY